jgi:hypothetical protein
MGEVVALANATVAGAADTIEGEGKFGVREEEEEAGGWAGWIGVRTMCRRRMVHLRMERNRPMGEEHLSWQEEKNP